MEYFNWKQYLINYPDLLINGVNNELRAWRHYNNSGLLENRTCNKLITNFFPKSKNKVLFTNARDELDLKEWIKYHLLLGFDCIYIFDHLSVNPLEDELYNFDSRVITIRINEKKSRIKFKCIELARKISLSIKAEWMLYLDSDEFLVLNKWNSISELLSEFNHADLIGINWLMFGTNNLINKPEKLIIESYTKSELLLNNHVKSFVRPEKINKINNPHTYILNSDKLYLINNTKLYNGIVLIDYPIEYYNSPGYIAHYVYQCEEVYKHRKVNRKNDLGQVIGYILNENIHTLYNDIDNTSVKDKYSENLKKELNLTI
jgi:hypothetical protein